MYASIVQELLLHSLPDQLDLQRAQSLALC
jgi:hypothetical protein